MANHNNIVQSWLTAFEAAIASGGGKDVAALFQQDSYWRDLLGFTWEFGTRTGPQHIAADVVKAAAQRPPRNFRLQGETELGSLGQFGETLNAYFTFETPIGLGRGLVRLKAGEGGSPRHRAFTLLTTMPELKGYPEKRGALRDPSYMRTVQMGARNWLDRRGEELLYQDRDPQVLIVGAGQAGLMLAARLRVLGVDTLVVDKYPRVGDVWRKRYHSLTLHNEIYGNHFPYLPFPDSWPVYVPKDKLAGWLEYYAEAMEINVWPGTTFKSGQFDADAKHWTAVLQLADGSERTLKPKIVVLATGPNGAPNVPQVPGLDSFAGQAFHSSGETENIETRGKKALVIGAGTSAHDTAQDLYLRGAEVTMLQRSSTTIVSIPSAAMASMVYQVNEGKRPIQDTDLIAASVPFDLVRRLQGPLSKVMAENDKDMLDKLAKIGFQLDNGEDDTGFYMKLLRRLSGYYFNVGASDLLIEGKIKLKSGVALDHVTRDEAVFSDGSRMKIDILAFGTGYKPMQYTVGQLFGQAVADRVGPVWGIGENGELRNMFCRTRQENFFIAGGTLPQCRYFSPYTALLIKATLEGIQ